MNLPAVHFLPGGPGAAARSLLGVCPADHREIVERNVAPAARPGEGVAALDGLRLLAPVRLNVVCLILADDPTEARVAALARAVAESGETFLTPTVYGGMPGLRAAFSNWRTTEEDGERVLAALTAALAG